VTDDGLSTSWPGFVPAIHVLLAATKQERRGCPRQARAWRASSALLLPAWHHFPQGPHHV